LVHASMRVEPQAKEMRLGDTLTVTIEVPYNNFDSQKNVLVSTAGFKVSEFGLEFGIINRVGDKLMGEGPEQFNVTFIKGGLLPGTSRFQNRFAIEADRYVYIVKIVPLKKGLVNIVNRRVEARDGCTLIDFTPICINNPKNHDLYYQLSSFLGCVPNPNFSSTYPQPFLYLGKINTINPRILKVPFWARPHPPIRPLPYQRKGLFYGRLTKGQ
jgi:hypothetical protein